MTDSPSKFDRNADSKPKPSPLEDLIDLDAKLLSMVARRCRMVQRAARGRQVLDRDLEKQLRLGFDQAAKNLDLDPRLARQLFPVLNAFGLEPQETRRSADKPFALIPRSEPADIDILGPRSLARTRMLAVLAAAVGAPMRLSGVVLNDPLIELVKALNQAGAHLSWTADELTSSETQAKAEDSPLRFEDVLVFAGEEPFTLYVLLALALREAGRSKFAGGPNLKFLDLRHLDAILPLLGARLAPMNPRSRGLPARLESGGRMASRLELTPETPPQFAQALALAAWSYPEGLRLTLCAEPIAAAGQALALNEVLEVLNLCQVPARRQGNEYLIPPAQAKVPAAPALPLDPALSAYLLALPALAGGMARLSGSLALPQAVREDFAALGLPLSVDAGIAESRSGSLNPGVDLCMGRQAEYLPLALAPGREGWRRARAAAPGPRSQRARRGPAGAPGRGACAPGRRVAGAALRAQGLGGRLDQPGPAHHPSPGPVLVPATRHRHRQPRRTGLPLAQVLVRLQRPAGGAGTRPRAEGTRETCRHVQKTACPSLRPSPCARPRSPSSPPSATPACAGCVSSWRLRTWPRAFFIPGRSS